MVIAPRMTTADLDAVPDPLDGRRYEIIDGELHVTKQPDWEHQLTCGQTYSLLQHWSARTGAGVANLAPGLLFAEDDNVAPDVVWVSRERLPAIRRPDGKLHAAPDLVVEVLSPGPVNERRDRDFKLKLYSRQGAREYWILDWQQRQMEVFRRDQAALTLVATLYEQDTLESPLLPGFSCRVGDLFSPLLDATAGPMKNGIS
jgi:Uma2 family endonuclease